MTLDAVTPRLGLAAAKHHHIVRKSQTSQPAVRLQTRAGSCSGSGALYAQPAGGAVVDSAKQTKLQWDPNCLDNSDGAIDIYLYAPTEPTANLPIHAWTQIPASRGSYDVKLAPKWWNATASVELSLNIVAAGNQPWDSVNPFGPTWYATYTAPTDGSAPPADAVQGSDDSNALVSIFLKGGHLTPGGKAAAIVCPLIVLFVGIGILIRKMHINRNNKTADWAEHVDKRMSQISIDWMNGGDGRAGPIPGSRPASFLARPQSSYRPSLEAVRAFYNANVGGNASTEDEFARYENVGDMSEVGSHVNASESMSHVRQSNYRVSRVSFAPSMDTTDPTQAGSSIRNARNSRHSMPRVGANGGFRSSRLHRESQATASIPRVSSNLVRDNSGQLADADEGDDAEFIMSPVQEAGATPVNFDALMSETVDHDLRTSMMDYPAVEMMRGSAGSPQHSRSDAHPDAYDEAYPTESFAHEQMDESQLGHAAADQRPQLETGMRPPANATSPDEAMRQYAALRSAGHAPGATSSNTMRTLYSSNSQRRSPVTSPTAAPARSNSDASVRRKPVKRGSSIYIDADASDAGNHEAGSSADLY